METEEWLALRIPDQMRTESNAAGGEMIYREKSAGHWTPLGCRLIAESLSERILDEDLLRKCE